MKRKLLVLSAIFIAIAAAGYLLLKRPGPGVDPVARGVEGPSGEKPAANPMPDGKDLSFWASRPPSKSQETMAVFQEWLAAIARNDGARAGEIAQELSRLLHKGSRNSAEVYERIRQMLGDPSVSMDAKMGLIHLLSRAAAPQAVALFLDMAKGNPPENLKQWIYSAIAETGEYWWNKGSSYEVAPMLLKAWADARNPELLQALAAAIAKVGDLRGIDQLFDVVLGQGSTIAGIQESRDARVQAALSALGNVRNPDLVSAIAGRLAAGGNEAESAICAGILAQMENVEATRALLEWAQNADSSSTALIQNAFSRIWDSNCLDYLSAALPSTRFRSSQVQSAVLESINKS